MVRPVFSFAPLMADSRKTQISCIGMAVVGVIMVENDRSRESAADD